MSYNQRRNRPVESADANLMTEIFEFMPILAEYFLQNGVPQERAQGAAHAASLFVRKFDRMCMQNNPFTYDIDCAVDRLHDHLEHTQRQTVPATEVRAWCQRLERDYDDAVLRTINEAFNTKHGRRAVGW
jgi:hypothetical protein